MNSPTGARVAGPQVGAGHQAPQLGSQQVSWWATHEFLEAAVAQANCGPLPTAGTPAWCALSDGDPRKLLALAAAGEHWALRLDTAQEHLAEASREISSAADWSSLARHVQTGRGSRYVPRARGAA